MLRADRLVGKRRYFPFRWPNARVTANTSPSRETLHFTVMSVTAITMGRNQLG